MVTPVSIAVVVLVLVGVVMDDGVVNGGDAADAGLMDCGCCCCCCCCCCSKCPLSLVLKDFNLSNFNLNSSEVGGGCKPFESWMPLSC